MSPISKSCHQHPKIVTNKITETYIYSKCWQNHYLLDFSSFLLLYFFIFWSSLISIIPSCIAVLNAFWFSKWTFRSNSKLSLSIFARAANSSKGEGFFFLGVRGAKFYFDLWQPLFFDRWAAKTYSKAKRWWCFQLVENWSAFVKSSLFTNQ